MDPASRLRAELELTTSARVAEGGDEPVRVLLVTMASGASLLDVDAARRERLRAAMDRASVVVPVTFGPGALPPASAVAGDLQPLLQHHVAELREGRSWERDVADLVRDLPGLTANPRGERQLRLQREDLAPVGARVAATVLDAVLVFIPFGLLSSYLGDEASVLQAVLVVALCATWVMQPILAAGRRGPHNGQSLGRQLVGIRVIRRDGEPLTYGLAGQRLFLKTVFCVLSASLVLVPLVIALVQASGRGQGRMWHDRFAETVVVRASVEPRAARLS